MRGELWLILCSELATLQITWRGTCWDLPMGPLGACIFESVKDVAHTLDHVVVTTMVLVLIH